MVNSFKEDIHYTRLDHAIATFLSDRSSDVFKNNQAHYSTFKGIVRDLSASLAKGHSCIVISQEHQEIMKSSGMVSTNANTPLILEASRLYLHRYWKYETQLANQLKYKVGKPLQPPENLSQRLDHYFSAEKVDSSLKSDDQTDWQRLAAENVAQQSFSIITGGPGTGKTTTVLKILALLQEITEETLTIALAAPTGKAAMRLQESIGRGKKELLEKQMIDETLKQSIPEAVSTIHRLLGAKLASPYFRHHADNPLIHDLVVIDEASMVDLALMSKLVDALKPDARLILLGDKDQLASVESGAILNDLSQGLPKNTSELKHSYRFDTQIKDFAFSINQQDKNQAWDILLSDDYPSISLVQESLLLHIMSASKSYFSAVKKGLLAKDIFDVYQQFQVLCSNRRGQWGVEGINHRVEQMLYQEEGINVSQPWYLGKPVIITRNDPNTQLFNGDIGLCLKEEGDLFVFFQLANGDIKKLLPNRLPQHETAYALTIHKSQGSEFNHVLMVLPEKPSPVLGKELVYTAITRAKEKVEVASSQQVFDYALSQQVERNSGLRDKVAG